MKIFIKLLYVVVIVFSLNAANAQLLELFKNIFRGCKSTSDCIQGHSCIIKEGGGGECKKSTDANSELEKKASNENADQNKQSKSESEPIKLYPLVNENTFAGSANIGKVIYFEYDSFTVRPEYRSTIEAHAQYLKSNVRARLSIEGHTDKRFPSLEYSLTVSQKRAYAVHQYLTLLGVEASQIEAVSFGTEKPAVQGNDETAHARNRRVEFFYR